MHRTPSSEPAAESRRPPPTASRAARPGIPSSRPAASWLRLLWASRGQAALLLSSMVLTLFLTIPLFVVLFRTGLSGQLSAHLSNGVVTNALRISVVTTTLALAA